MFVESQSLTLKRMLHVLLRFGFQENHCIDRALISITEGIRSILDDMQLGCSIFIDIQKAFDAANHEILIKKLEHYDIRGGTWKWSLSCLTDRRKFISINGHNSTTMESPCDVLQG